MYINRLKPYAKQCLTEEPVLDEDDKFDEDEERVVNRTELEDVKAPPDDKENVIKKIKQQISKNGVLEFNLCWEDGDVT